MATPRPGAALAGRNPGGRIRPEGRQWDSTPEHGTTCGLNPIEETCIESHDRRAEEGHHGQDVGHENPGTPNPPMAKPERNKSYDCTVVARDCKPLHRLWGQVCFAHKFVC